MIDATNPRLQFLIPNSQLWANAYDLAKTFPAGRLNVSNTPMEDWLVEISWYDGTKFSVEASDVNDALRQIVEDINDNPPMHLYGAK